MPFGWASTLLMALAAATASGSAWLAGVSWLRSSSIVRVSIEKLERIESVVVEAVAPDPTRPTRLAIWLVAWLAGQLDWKPQGQPENQQADDSSSGLIARISRCRGRSVRSHRHPHSAARLPGLASDRLGHHQDPAARCRPELRRDPFGLSGLGPARRLCWSRPRRDDSTGLPRGVDAPELDTARRIAAALESSRIDLPFRNAFPIALWLMEPLIHFLLARTPRFFMRVGMTMRMIMIVPVVVRVAFLTVCTRNRLGRGKHKSAGLDSLGADQIVR